MSLASLVAQMVKNPPAMPDIWVQTLGWEEKGMATHSSILPWRIPWTEELGGLQSMGSQRVWRNWATKHSTAHCWYKQTSEISWSFPPVLQDCPLASYGLTCLCFMKQRRIFFLLQSYHYLKLYATQKTQYRESVKTIINLSQFLIYKISVF